MKSILAAQAAAKASSGWVPRKRYDKPKPPKPPALVQVTLSLRHSLNGQFYGPGTIMLPEHKARRLLNTEQEAQEKELSLVQQRAFIMGFRNGVPMRREVPYQRFDEILTREELTL